jgi:SAM-dependent methyltransferase
MFVQESDQRVWQDFLQWLTSAPSVDSPALLLSEYRKKLEEAGTPQPDVAQVQQAIARQLKTRDEGWQAIFNNIYSSSRSGFSRLPNGTLVSAVTGRAAGRALDAGVGQGRNALYLAMKGWDVTGFDVSDAGLAIARANAEQAGVKLTIVQKSGKDFDFGESQWDLILFCYVPFPVTEADYVERLRRSVRPGGLVVVESFASEAGGVGRRPVDIAPAELRSAFNGFSILRLDDVIDTPDWLNEKMRLVRMVAEKSAVGE